MFFIGHEIDFVADEVPSPHSRLGSRRVEYASPRTIFGSSRRSQALPAPRG
jgi:hypothetical protein